MTINKAWKHKIPNVSKLKLTPILGMFVYFPVEILLSESSHQILNLDVGHVTSFDLSLGNSCATWHIILIYIFPIKQKFIRIAYLYNKCTDCRINIITMSTVIYERRGMTLVSVLFV
jgi:hypothetical protein